MSRKHLLVNRIRATLEDGVRGPRPDLGWIARELGRNVLAGSDGRYADQLNGLRGRSRGFSRWQIGESRRAPWTALLLVWPPGHVTPLHDHAGLWGMEMVVDGSLEVQTYAVDPATQTPLPRNRHWLGISDALWFEADENHLHRCRNLSLQHSAVTLHVYGGRLQRYTRFELADDHHWARNSEFALVSGRL